MSAEIDFDRWREPAERPVFLQPPYERGSGKDSFPQRPTASNLRSVPIDHGLIHRSQKERQHDRARESPTAPGSSRAQNLHRRGREHSAGAYPRSALAAAVVSQQSSALHSNRLTCEIFVLSASQWIMNNQLRSKEHSQAANGVADGCAPLQQRARRRSRGNARHRRAAAFRLASSELLLRIALEYWRPAAAPRSLVLKFMDAAQPSAADFRTRSSIACVDERRLHE